jgi:hypothetical protein
VLPSLAVLKLVRLEVSADWYALLALMDAMELTLTVRLSKLAPYLTVLSECSN